MTLVVNIYCAFLCFFVLLAARGRCFWRISHHSTISSFVCSPPRCIHEASLAKGKSFSLFRRRRRLTTCSWEQQVCKGGWTGGVYRCATDRHHAGWKWRGEKRRVLFLGSWGGGGVLSMSVFVQLSDLIRDERCIAADNNPPIPSHTHTKPTPPFPPALSSTFHVQPWFISANCSRPRLK